MKYCTNCGQQISSDSYICAHCGGAVGEPPTEKTNKLDKAIKVFLIIGTIFTSLTCLLVPLIWCIPMTISGYKKIEAGEPLSTGYKVCVLLFVSVIAGILMLCREE